MEPAVFSGRHLFPAGGGLSKSVGVCGGRAARHDPDISRWWLNLVQADEWEQLAPDRCLVCKPVDMHGGCDERPAGIDHRKRRDDLDVSQHPRKCKGRILHDAIGLPGHFGGSRYGVLNGGWRGDLGDAVGAFRLRAQ